MYQVSCLALLTYYAESIVSKHTYECMYCVRQWIDRNMRSVSTNQCISKFIGFIIIWFDFIRGKKIKFVQTKFYERKKTASPNSKVQVMYKSNLFAEKIVNFHAIDMFRHDCKIQNPLYKLFFLCSVTLCTLCVLLASYIIVYRWQST